jgi:glutamate/tyrosine decarboxylase-like PLP-dependent enzyme
LHALPKLVLFTSADAHYSVKKLASFMGIGSDNVYLIRTDDIGKMDMKHLGMYYIFLTAIVKANKFIHFK